MAFSAPAGATEAEAASLLGWTRVFFPQPNDPDVCYFWNKKTGETIWSTPPSFIEAAEPAEPPQVALPMIGDVEPQVRTTTDATRVYVASDSVLKLSKKWYWQEVVETLKAQAPRVELQVRTDGGAGLHQLCTFVEQELCIQRFDVVIVLCMGDQVLADLDAKDRLVHVLRGVPKHFLVYGGESTWWTGMPPNFEEVAQVIRRAFLDEGINCEDGRRFFAQAGLTGSDFDKGNHIMGNSREKAVRWFENVVRHACHGESWKAIWDDNTRTNYYWHVPTGHVTWTPASCL